MATVSVIVPACSVAPDIGASIESGPARPVPDRELLIVDGGATGRTAAVAEAFPATDGGLRLLRQANARHRGGVLFWIAGGLRRWTPRLLSRACPICRTRREAAS
jgi:glycosyltransferase involved in cell wall biosynthesis